MSEADGKRCQRPRPKGAPECTQHDDHTGRCDWFVAAYEGVRAGMDLAKDARVIVVKQIDDAIGNARDVLSQWDVDGWAKIRDCTDTVDWAEDAARALRRLVNAYDALAGLES